MSLDKILNKIIGKLIGPKEMRKIPGVEPNRKAYGKGNGFPTTPQNTKPHKDGLWGRSYYDTFRLEKLGKPAEAGEQKVNEIINVRKHGDHWDVIERNIKTGHMYHNRIFEKLPKDPKKKGIII